MMLYTHNVDCFISFYYNVGRNNNEMFRVQCVAYVDMLLALYTVNQNRWQYRFVIITLEISIYFSNFLIFTYT